MHMLYDSDSFVLVYMPVDTGETPPASFVGASLVTRPGFELVDKRSGKEVYLDGLWAELFQQKIDHWQTHTPTQDEIEEFLSGYAELAQNPLIQH